MISVKFDVIERAKTPTKGDVLAARLKSLRSQADSPTSPSSAKNTATRETGTPSRQGTASRETTPLVDKTDRESSQSAQDDVDALFQTDDKALEEMLAGIDTPQPEDEPKEENVQALLEQLSASVPKDTDQRNAREKDDSDDSDGEKMGREVDDVISRFKDEIELDARNPPEEEDEEPPEAEEGTNDNADLALPSVPANLDISEDTSQRPKGIDDITARMAALRAPSTSDDLPSVPTSKPTKRVNRLTSKTNYTDDDVDSWCTVCLEDATLRCLGCDDDVYCTRCWREMHIGPSAAWDDRSHKAVQFTRNKKEKKVALGA